MLSFTSGWGLAVAFVASLVGFAMVFYGVKRRSALPLIFGVLICLVPLIPIPWLAGLVLVVLVAAYVAIWKTTS